MADPVQTAQANALEIPVTVQGSQIVAGTDRRELFTETTKTTLTLEKGAVVKLNARVAPGQSLFLRNELSGREILCRVLEAPAEDKSGYTDLEFTTHDPEFWTIRERPGHASEQESDAESEGAAESESAPSAEFGAPTSVPASEAESTASTQGAPEHPAESNAAAAPVLMDTHEPAPAAPAGVGEVDDQKDAERLAGILAKAAKRIAQRAAKAANEAQEDASAATAQPETLSARQKAFSTLAFRLHAIRELTVRNNKIMLSVVGAIVLSAAVAVGWDVRNMIAPPVPSMQVGPILKKPQAKPGAAATVASNPGKPAKQAVPATAAAPRIAAPSVAQVPAVRMEKNPSAEATSLEVVRPGDEAGGGEIDRETKPSPREKHEPGPAAPVIVPAKIVSQFQPPLPPWAKDVDVYGVVTLDAEIDEKGNLGRMKLVSGPRVLESAAEAAVGLWIFQPAMENGKPTTTHMELTVEFQR